jgi:hypothetical protein
MINIMFLLAALLFALGALNRVRAAHSNRRPQVSAGRATGTRSPRARGGPGGARQDPGKKQSSSRDLPEISH